MESGRLNTRVTIESVTETRTSSGAVARSWLTFAAVWAEVLPLRGREFYAAQAVAAETDVKIRIRYLAGVSPKMRVNVGGTLHDIRAVLNLGNRNETIELICKSGVNDG